MKKCKKCGNVTQDTMVFCPECGNVLKKDGKKAMISIIAAIATVLIVLLVGIVVWQFQIIKDQSDNAEKDVKEQSAQQNEDSGKEETTQEEKPTITPAKEAAKDVSVEIAQIDTYNFPEVSVYFSVKDLDGNYVDTISQKDISFYEMQGTDKQKIDGQFRSNKGNAEQKTVSFVMDISGSMSGNLQQEAAAARKIVELMDQEGGYYVSLTAFNDERQELLGFTDQKQLFYNVLDQLDAEGSTALYDTLENTLYKLANRQGQKYILAFTDGDDNVSTIEKDALIELAKQLRIPIYIIADSYVASQSDMKDIAERSGGAFYVINNIEELYDIYYNIFNMQKNMMVYTYDSVQQSQWCDITIELDGGEYAGSCTREYWAEKVSYEEKISNDIIAGVRASSTLAPQSDSRGNYTYVPENAVDGDYNTAWVEGVDGTGAGQYIELDFDAKHAVNGIEISNGYRKRKDLYEKNSRVRTVRICFSDGEMEEYVLDDVFQGTQRIDFSKAHETEYIRIEIVDVYEGTKYQDTCITDMSIY